MIDDLAPRQGVMFGYGNPEVGKTFVVLDAGLHVAAGRPYAGKPVQPVVPCSTWRRREASVSASAWQRRGMPKTFPRSSVRPHHRSARSGSKDGDAETIIAALRAQIPTFGGGPVAMVVLDTLNKVANGAEENSATEMGVFINNVEKISNELRCLVVVVHHDGKDGDRGMRGQWLFVGAVMRSGKSNPRRPEGGRR